MDDEKKLPKIVKWAGIVALIAIPVVVLLKARKANRGSESTENEDSNIFANELEE
jgi:hypothetical protein